MSRLQVNPPLRDLTVLIGRFSTWHNGHARLLSRAIASSKKTLIIIGSAGKARTVKNPWTASEREQMIRAWIGGHVGEDHQASVVFAYQRDRVYNHQQWLADVQEHVRQALPEGGRIVLTGSDRDASTFYLKEFPKYETDLVEEDEEISKALSATSIRDLYFGRKINGRPLTDREVDLINAPFVPKTTQAFMDRFRTTPEYAQLVKEYEFLEKHKQAWAVAPYAPIFQTVDAVVICAGHVLLVRRRNTPGQGLWALPGGYLNPNEWMQDACVRELIEETKISVSRSELYSAIVDDRTFEDPGRSLRGRIITRAYTIKLPDYVVNGTVKLPKVKGSDDAAHAEWFPLSEVLGMSDKLFEDHYDIIEMMVNRLTKERR